ncbi:MAG: glycosyltransferase [Anaerolineae bacterium]
MLASGSRDVQPYIALGKGLKDAGYHVSVLTSEDFAELVSAAGLDFRSRISVEALLQTDEWRKTIEGGNFLAIMARMNQEMKSRADQLARQLPNLLASI